MESSFYLLSFPRALFANGHVSCYLFFTTLNADPFFGAAPVVYDRGYGNPTCDYRAPDAIEYINNCQLALTLTLLAIPIPFH